HRDLHSFPTRRSSDLIKVNAGVKQGDPISPILFNLCMEPIIRKFKEAFSDPLEIQGLKIALLAFADDLVIVAKNAGEMRKMLSRSEEHTSELQSRGHL